MSINAKKKLLGGESPYEDTPTQAVNKTAVLVNPTVDVAALSERIEVQAQEIERLQRELTEKSAELQRLLSVVEDRSNACFREASERGKADGLKLYQKKLEELGENCTHGVDTLRDFFSEVARQDRLFIEKSLAETVSIAVAKIIGEVRINPNFLSDRISQVVAEMNPRGMGEIQVGSSLYGALKENKVAYDRVAKLCHIRCNPDMHPFDLLIETESEVVDAGYCTQVRKLHELISESMA